MSLMTDNAIAFEIMCPHCNTETEICDASCSALEIDDMMKMKYCANEDYDDCPIFLVKKLQRRR